MTQHQIKELAIRMMGQHKEPTSSSVQESLIRVRKAIANQSPATRINLSGRFTSGR